MPQQRLINLLLIKKGEQSQVIYFLLLFFFIGAGMALGRGASEALFFKRYGIEHLPTMFIITSVLLCSVSIVYAAFVDRLPAESFYKILFVILAAALLGGWLAVSFSDTLYVYPAFFLLYEVASELLLIHCAVYTTQNLVHTQSRRLMPLILAGHQTGVICGGILLAVVSPLLGVQNIMLLWILLLVFSYLIVSFWHARHGLSPYFRYGIKGCSNIKQSLDQLTQGLKLMKTSRLLRMSSFSMFFMVVMVYVLAYCVNSIYTMRFDTEESLVSFFGLLTAVTGILALMIQILLTNRLIRDMGIKHVNFIFPLASIFSYITLLASFTLPAAILGSFNRETLMPAFAKPVRNIFHAALPTKLQGRAQAIFVILVIPLGLACAGVFLHIVQNIENFSSILLIGLSCAIMFLVFNNEMNQAYALEILSNLKKRLFVPDSQLDAMMQGKQQDIIKEIEQGMMNDDDNISIVYARILCRSAPERAARLIPIRLKKAGNAAKDQMIRILQSVASADLKKSLIDEIGSGDSHLDATIYKALYKARELDEKHHVETMLKDRRPRMKAVAIYGALHYPLPELYDTAVSEWLKLLESDNPDACMPAVELLIPEFAALYLQAPLRNAVLSKLKQLLQDDDVIFHRRGLEILATWPAARYDDIDKLIRALSKSSDWTIRKTCVDASHLLTQDDREQLLTDSLEDPHPKVRKAAITILAGSQSDDIGFIQNWIQNRKMGSPRPVRAMLEYLMNAGADADTMHSISLHLAKDAVRLKHASRLLSNSGGTESEKLSLLLHALEERIIETIDLALYAIQSSNHEQDIGVIRAGLQSRDNRQYANACELLTLLNNRELRSIIVPLFEDRDAEKKAARDTESFANISSLITWIRSRSDPWLNECVNYYSASLDNKDHA